jgi:hypothetical protein
MQGYGCFNPLRTDLRSRGQPWSELHLCDLAYAGLWLLSPTQGYGCFNPLRADLRSRGQPWSELHLCNLAYAGLWLL